MAKTVARKDETTQWPYIRWKESRQRWMVDARTKDGGERRYFESKPAAEGFATQQRTLRQNEGATVFDDRELASHGWTVAQAIRFALEHLRKQAGSVVITEAVSSLIEAKRNAKRTERYCNDLNLRLGRLSAAFDGKTVAQITTGDLEGFLAGLNVAAETRNTFRRDIRTLWSFSERRGWAVAATAKNTERAQADDRPPGILTPAQAAGLLKSSADPELRAFHAIGLFAGLRVKEIKMLRWEDIDFESGLINVAATVSKTRSRRLVPILDNLRSWLEPTDQKSGRVITKDLRKLHEAARRTVGFGRPGSETDEEKKAKVALVPWPDNAMRHSFVSYRLTATGNAAQTALESGHDQAVLFGHYRELTKPKAAAAYFEIVPLAG